MPEKLRFEIFVADLDRTVDFYVRVLEFVVLRDERASETPYLYMRRGEVRIGALTAPAAVPERVRRPPIGVELVLEVADLDAEHDRILSAGWSLTEPITARPWGLRDFRLLDPDGYYWRMTTYET
jgi:predicted enzyme related to lactoylglutathione lyase